MEEYKVKEAKLFEDEGEYYIDVIYLHENDKCVKEVEFPRVHVPIEQWRGDVDYTAYAEDLRGLIIPIDSSIRLGKVNLDVSRLNHGCGPFMMKKIIKEKTQEMTLEEIEKKLGHKVKIVSKKK